MSETRIDLQQLVNLQALFFHLNSGRYLNRLHDHELWVALEKYDEQYKHLFAALGYELRMDSRGFAWFWCEDASSSVTDASRYMALVLLCLLEYQADKGLQLTRFMEWEINETLLVAVVEKHAALLEAEALSQAEELVKEMKRLVRHGFAVELPDKKSWRLLAASYRYLDEFEALAGRLEMNRLSDEEDGEGVA